MLIWISKIRMLLRLVPMGKRIRLGMLLGIRKAIRKAKQLVTGSK